ncbi:glycoside hydrolase family 3 protein [Streptomyces sp. YIM S03343]
MNGTTSSRGTRGRGARVSSRGRRRTTLVVALALIAGLGATVPAHSDPEYPFRDPSLSVDARVSDLLSRLTLDEKISLLHQYEPAIPRLGIQSFRTGTEALHGVAWLGRTTVFPQAVGLASTWDPALIKQVGSAVGDEARGFQQTRPAGWGLNLWAPVVNLLRDPRWGRNEEGYSEDPYLTGSISTAYGTGLTGGDPDHLKTAPTLKHFLANNNEVNRDTTSSELRPRVLKEYDEQAFQPAIEADAATGVMSSYNLVNGRPDTVSPALNDTVRNWTSADLLNLTDAYAPGNLTGSQKYYATQPEADAAALRAGIDSFTDNDTNSAVTTTAIKSALSSGLLNASDIDKAAGHILNIRVRLGEFDPGGGKYGAIDASVIDSPAHRALARKAATEAAVLLKNQGGTLPLRKSTSAAVVGPLSDTLYTDWYSGTLPYAVTPKDGIEAKLGTAVASSEGVDRITLRNTATGGYVTAGGGDSGAALKETAAVPGTDTQFDVFDWGAGVVTLRSAANGRYVGYNWSNFVNDQTQPNGWFVQQQFKLEKQDDGTYLLRYAGYETAESWWSNPVYLGPTGADGTLGLVTKEKAAHYTKDVVRDGTAEAVAAVKGKDTAVVVVGSMPAINGREAHDRTDTGLAPTQEALVKAVKAANPKTVVIVENSYPTTLGALQKQVPALLWTTHAGQETGNALADLLYGDANPAGRLTQTWYRSDSDLPSILDYDIIKSARTYEYFKGNPLYPFGYGLSYTKFRYSDLRRTGDGYTVRITNTGTRTGAEVAQLYTHQRTSRDKQPLKQLQSYARVTLKPGETKTVHLKLPRTALAHWDVTRDKWVVETSMYDVMVGSSSTDIHARTSWQVKGETIPPRNLTKVTRAENFDDYAEGIHLVDESKTSGTAVSSASDGAWLKFADAQLGSGAHEFSARVAGTTGGTIEVRLGSPTGTLAGTAHFSGTSSAYDYTTVTADLTKAAKGRTDMYLVLGKGVRLSTFTLR